MNAAYITETIARQRIAEIERRARRPRPTPADDERPHRLVLRLRWNRRAARPAAGTGPMTLATS